ncbi:MAG: SOS response-associated peptidase [Planctomycetota bacterium]|nr:SOS response-associated peptidase [Planctomycetota bacterium]MDA1113812.1 SOS response-associated peptidase [Planctomycetota bacterium]
MCGRFQFVPKGNAIWVDEFGLPADSSFPERVNLAPSQDAPVVVHDSKGSSLKAMQWGLIPSWSSVIERPKAFINARVETVSVKPSFREAWCLRRCLILTTGYYEWTRKGGPATLVERPDHGVFSFAGLWEPNLSDKALGKPSCTILTTSAASEIQELHPRMPVMVSRDMREAWLRDGNLGFELQGHQELPFKVSTRLVGRRLNKVSHDDTSCLKVDPPDALPSPGLFD